jgi:hypothetical protein
MPAFEDQTGIVVTSGNFRFDPKRTCGPVLESQSNRKRRRRASLDGSKFSSADFPKAMGLSSGLRPYPKLSPQPT